MHLRLATAASLATMLFMSAPALAQNVSAARHPNIAAAQTHAQMAIDSMTAAQTANEYDVGGHAAKAKALLAQAMNEMKLAAVAANQRR